MVMIIYELLVDWDGTLRSRYCSQGLFQTPELADDYRKLLKLQPHQNWKIKGRKLVTKTDAMTFANLGEG
jgi:hypothetical protein